MSEWWESFFDEVWEKAGFASRGDEAPTEELDYIQRRLRLESGSSLVDICCGIGRHSVPLARRGVRVYGVDLTARYLERAADRSEGLPLRLRRADMRDTGLPDDAFDGVLNWWTSFGYFADEAENARALAEWSRLLRPGGRLLMLLINRDGLMTNFRPRSGRIDESGWALIEDAELDYRSGRVENRWTWISPEGERHERHLSLRLYALHELVALGAGVGLSLETAHGDLEGAPADRHHTHMYITLVKDC